MIRMMKDTLVSLAAGAAIVLILFSLTATGVGFVANAFLAPGALAADVVGLGIHDIGGFVFYILGNLIVYAALSFLLIEGVRKTSASS